MLVYQQQSKYSKAFTLLELMVTVAIASIVMTMGVPGFSQVIKNSRLTTDANAMIASFNFARSEAVKRQREIYVRRKGSSSENWDSGWDIFIDENSNQTFNDGTDELLKTFSSSKNTVRAGEIYDDWIAFKPSGVIDSSGTSDGDDSFRICATAGDTNNSRKITINRVGRSRVSEGGVASCP